MKTLEDFLRLLHRMEKAYRPDENPNMRWVFREREIITDWLARLRAASEADAVNDLWRAVQNVSHAIGTAIDDELGREHQVLETRLWEDMAELVAEARRQEPTKQ